MDQSTVRPVGTPNHLTAEEAAAILNVSKWTIYRRFGNLPGVINIAEEGSRKRFLRIPDSVIAKYIIRHQVR